MLVEPARAKLNLALHVRARRPDGYHELETLFAFVADGDEVRLDDGPPGLTIEGPFAKGLADEGDNLVSRAAAAYRAAFGGAEAALTLVKRLPVASGLGGGSADAAATLRVLALRDGLDPADPALFAIAAALGSDVPACLASQTAIGRGRGERLEPVAGASGVPVLLVNPRVPVPTGDVFRRWDGKDRGPLPAGDALAIARAGRNDLEPPARAMAPVIGEVLAALEASEGVILARMSGSGATCFALFGSEAARGAAAHAVGARQPGWWCLETALA